jgi:hypothetical protein
MSASALEQWSLQPYVEKCRLGGLVEWAVAWYVSRLISGNGYIEGTELDGFLREFVSSANATDVSPEVSRPQHTFSPSWLQNLSRACPKSKSSERQSRQNQETCICIWWLVLGAPSIATIFLVHILLFTSLHVSASTGHLQVKIYTVVFYKLLRLHRIRFQALQSVTSNYVM